MFHIKLFTLIFVNIIVTYALYDFRFIAFVLCFLKMNISISILVSKNIYCNILKMFHVKQFINSIEFIIRLNFQDLYNTLRLQYTYVMPIK